MAFGKDTTDFWLQSGNVFLGIWTNPDTVGTDATFPSTKFSGDIIGNIVQGTQIANLATEFVEALGGTPQKLLRKDVIRNQFTIEGGIYEKNGDIMQTIHNMRTQPTFDVTIPTAKTLQLSHIGTDQPIRTIQGILIQAKDVNGRDIEIAMYAGLFTSEGLAFDMGGTTHIQTDFKVEATPHPNFTTLLQDQDNLGYVMVDRT